jgi:ubiquinone/menaquinone biosynthesis C-methylase UbiE
MRFDFSKRSTDAELMDLPDADEARLFRTLDQFQHINRVFSQVRPLLRKTILRDMQPGTDYHMIDIGAGACDIPIWMLHEAGKRGLTLRITAVDSDPRVVRYARERHAQIEGLSIHEADALKLGECDPFHYVFANHFLHHLPDEVIPQLLRDLHRLSQRGFVISDLRRSRWSYLGFSLVSRLYRDSFARTDGLISIRKGFQPADIQRYAPDLPLKIQTALPGRIQLLGGIFA